MGHGWVPRVTSVGIVGSLWGDVHDEDEEHEDDEGEEAAKGRAPLIPKHLVHRLGLAPLPLLCQELGVGGHDHRPTGPGSRDLYLTSHWVLDEEHGDASGGLGRTGRGRGGDDEASSVVGVADLASKGVGPLFADPSLNAVVVGVLLSTAVRLRLDSVLQEEI